MTSGVGQERREYPPADSDGTAALRPSVLTHPRWCSGSATCCCATTAPVCSCSTGCAPSWAEIAAQFIDAGTLSFSLLPYMEAAHSMLVIDAADLGGAPGTIRLFEGAAMDRFLTSTRRRSVHEVGLIDLLDMARLQDCLPHRRALLCIQPERIDWSETLSAPVAEALTEASRQATALLRRWQSA